MLRPDRRSGGARAVLTAIGALLIALAIGAPALAQDDSGADETLGGTLRTRDEAGENIFVEGATFTVFDADGNEVGSSTTDAEGAWLVPLPGPGFYSVELDESTLAEGVSLREGASNPLTGIEVQPGTTRNTLFPLGERVTTEDNTIRSVQLFVDGIKLGMIIAMCAIGLSLIYGTTGLTNFAHGEMVTFGAMVAFVFHVTWQVSWLGSWMSSLVFAGVVAIVITGVAGWLFNEYVWKRLRNRGASLIAALVVSIGFSILARYVLLYQFGGRAGFYRDYRIGQQVDFGVFSLLRKDIFIIVFALAVLVAVGVALQRTRIGKAMRAVADNRDLAESSGIDVEKVIRWVWIVGSALAGLGGVLFGLTENINWEMGFRLLLLMFAGVTLGGLGTAYGALFGSIIAGIFIQMSTLVIPSDMKNVGALITLIVILLVRPQGLLGRAERIG
ncbi:MAG: branched-chain amino acid ABC transporter permease [Ilumatobacter sp.]|nr:branched-chain amino acid ABC transporter permease [Ilumatobacter sp.]